MYDLFQPDQILTTVVGEFLAVTNYCRHTSLIMHQVFSLLSRTPEEKSIVNNWVLLSINSFLQRSQKSSIMLSVWSLACLFVSSSSNCWIKSWSRKEKKKKKEEEKKGKRKKEKRKTKKRNNQ